MEWPILEVLSAEGRDSVIRMARRRRFARNEVIFHEGDPGDTLHLVAKGHVALRITTPLGDVATVRVLRPGDFFGELALISPGPRNATRPAVDPVETFAIHREQLDELRGRGGAVDRVIIEALVADAEASRPSRGARFYVPVEKRIWRRLLELAHVFEGRETVPIRIPLTQEDLAQIVGTTRPTINRALKEAERAGVVHLSRGGLEILDRGAVAHSHVDRPPLGHVCVRSDTHRTSAGPPTEELMNPTIDPSRRFACPSGRSIVRGLRTTTILLAATLTTFAVASRANAKASRPDARLTTCSAVVAVGQAPSFCRVPDPAPEDTLPEGYDSGIRPTVKGLQYGPDPADLVDLYLPESTGPAPVIVFLHGGGWIGGTRTAVAQSLLQQVPRDTRWRRWTTGSRRQRSSRHRSKMPRPPCVGSRHTPPSSSCGPTGSSWPACPRAGTSPDGGAHTRTLRAQRAAS